jgi:hypothetical protein
LPHVPTQNEAPAAFQLRAIIAPAKESAGSEPRALQEYIPRPTSDLAFITVLNLGPILELIPILIGLLRDLVFEFQDFDTEILQPSQVGEVCTAGNHKEEKAETGY